MLMIAVSFTLVNLLFALYHCPTHYQPHHPDIKSDNIFIQIQNDSLYCIG